MQTSDEKKEKYKLEDYKLIQNQTLQTNITRTVRQIVRRIINEIFGVKGLIALFLHLILQFQVSRLHYLPQ